LIKKKLALLKFRLRAVRAKHNRHIFGKGSFSFARNAQKRVTIAIPFWLRLNESKAKTTIAKSTRPRHAQARFSLLSLQL
jgi:hypothetical protein